MNSKTASLRGALGIAVVTGVAACLASFASPAVHAIERYIVPEQGAGGPFYARLERGFVHMTDQWVAVVFYREPSCVRVDFNLLEFFDFAGIPAIFGCQLTVHGMEIWKNGAGSDAAPMQSKSFGNGAIPVWFVSVSDFDAAVADDVLTIAELQAMASLRRGYATYFEETLHPAGGAVQTMLHISSYGGLEDGGSFSYKATEAGGVLTTVRIEFK